MKAKAAVANGSGGFTIEEIEVGHPKNNEVLVELKASGVCHTDYDSMKWDRLIMGHEGAGIVKAIGEYVTRLKPGDRVLLNWAIPCGTCFQCIQGNQSLCEEQSPVTASQPLRGHPPLERTTLNGKGIKRSFNIGTMSTATIVLEEAVVKIDVDIPFASACIIGCGVMTGYGSVVNVAKVRPGASVAVLGTGGVGLNVIQGAKIAGAEKIIAIDINSKRLDLAKTFGATDFVLATENDADLLKASEAVKKLTEGRGADYAFECTAVPSLGAAPLAMVRNAGTAVQVSGIEQTISFNMELFEWDKIYINPLYGKCNPQRDLKILLKLYEKGALLLDEMVTTTYALEELEQAFLDMHQGKNAKGVLILE